MCKSKSPILARRKFLCAVLALSVLVLSSVSPSATLGKVLYRFKGGRDGSIPYGGVIADAQGNLYGTTSAGGGTSCYQIGCGTVFELSPTGSGGWTEKILYSFQGGSDGATPLGGLVFDAKGNLYGTTMNGGSGGGVVYGLSPNPDGGWMERSLYVFNGNDGWWPAGRLVLDSKGNLYGVTVNGGRGCGGIVFEVSPEKNNTWTGRTLHDFGNGFANDGCVPDGHLIMDSAGNLFGTTDKGGPGWGTVFELSPVSGGQWKEHILHYFGVGYDGAEPAGSLTLDASGDLYGATYLGGSFGWGTFFELTPTSSGQWSETILHNFGIFLEGGLPGGDLVFDSHGSLYGEAGQGGLSGCIRTGCGLVFQFSPDGAGNWTETVLWDSAVKSDGGSPFGGISFDAEGNLYGTTQGGSGTLAYYGAVFKIEP